MKDILKSIGKYLSKPQHLAHPIAYLILFFAAFCFLLFFAPYTSPLSDAEWGDYVIYKYIGLGILQGKMPYLDLNDNKGPILYLINALGLSFPFGRWGLFFLEVISLSLTLFFLYRAVLLLLPCRTALLSTILALLLLGGLYQGGDHVEEWMLPFISLILMKALSLIKSPSPDIKQVFSMSLWGGVGTAAVLMLRPNDAFALAGGIVIGLLVYFIRCRCQKLLLPSLVIFLLGFILIVAPIMIWITTNGALPSMVTAMFTANFHSVGSASLFGASLFKWGKWAILLLLITLWIMTHNVDKTLNTIFIPLGVMQLLMIGGKLFAHYLIVLFPLLVMFIALLSRQKNRSLLALALAILFLSHRPVPRMMVNNAVGCYHQLFSSRAEIEKEVHEVLSLIPRDTSFWNYNLDPWQTSVPAALLLREGIVQCNRHIGYPDNLAPDKDFYTESPEYVVAINDDFQKDTDKSSLYCELKRTAGNTIDLRLYQRLH